ncbi:MAG TPA: hypothetical protein P5089_03545 [Candidatus Portnoybacteria bacterium]|nr:hypothetical protein [Candidatus Portnoybacteria bacterium]
MGRIKDIFLGGAVDQIVTRVLKTFMSQGTGIMGEKIQSFIKHPPQASFMRAILMLEPEDAESFRYLLKKAKEEGRMKEMVMTISAALPLKDDGSLDTNEARVVMAQIAKANPEVLDQLFEALSHSSLTHQLEHELEHMGNALEKVALQIAYTVGATNKSLELYAEEHKEKHFVSRLADILFR